MAFSGLQCPYCNSNLLENANHCNHCHATIGKKELQKSTDLLLADFWKGFSTLKILHIKIRQKCAKIFSAIRFSIRAKVIRL